MIVAALLCRCRPRQHVQSRHKLCKQEWPCLWMLVQVGSQQLQAYIYQRAWACAGHHKGAVQVEENAA